MNEAVQDRVGVGGIADYIMPAVHRDLTGDDSRAAAISLFEDFEKVVAGADVECLKSPVVEDQDVDASESAKDAQMAPGVPSAARVGAGCRSRLLSRMDLIEP